MEDNNLKEEEAHIQTKDIYNNFLSILELIAYTKYIKNYHKLNNEFKKEPDDFSNFV